MKHTTLLLTFFLSYSITLVSQSDITRIIPDDDTKSMAVTASNEEIFLVGTRRKVRDSWCEHSSIQAYDRVDSLLWTLDFEGQISQIEYDTSDQTFLIGIRSNDIDVLPPEVGSFLYRVDKDGNLLFTYKHLQNDNSDNGYFSIYHHDTLLLSTSQYFARSSAIKWMDRLGTALDTKTYDFVIDQLASFGQTLIVVRSSGKLIFLDNKGVVQEELSFDNDKIAQFQIHGEWIYTTHDSTLRRYHPNTQTWQMQAYDTDKYDLNGLSISEEYAYVFGINLSNQSPAYLELDTASLIITNPLLFDQAATNLQNLFHFKNEMVLIGTTNFGSRSQNNINRTDNSFLHQTEIGKAAAFPDLDIRVDELSYDPLIYSSIDTINTPNDTFIIVYTEPIDFNLTVINNSPDTIREFSLHSKGDNTSFCNILGNFKKTFTGLSLAPGESYIVSDMTHNGIRIELGRPFYLSFTAYAPNQQFDAQPEDNSASVLINFDPSTSNRTLSPTTTFQVFPNPATSYLSVNSPDQVVIQQIDIYDLSGKRQMTSYPQAPEWRGDIMDLPAGSYFVKILTKSGINWQKVIKQ